MQLFIHNLIKIQADQIELKNASDIIHQLRKVLRAKPGYYFFVQNDTTRRGVELLHRTDETVLAQIKETIPIPLEENSSAMLIALPNKQEKLELIVQKLTEIGIHKIYLRSSERSVIKQLSTPKQDRLHKIIQEAVEQSWGWSIPKIYPITDLDLLKEEYQFCVFDLKKNNKHHDKITDKPFLGIIGPEGGLTDKDYQQFGTEREGINLGETVLRMETAAIIGGWMIKQGKINL